jgi:putative transcriptional regulator
MGGELSLAGHFLISGINLVDPNFFRTVILMIRHNADGAFGLIVNRPAERTLGNILPELKGGEALDMPVYIGGPVQQDFLFVLHSGLPGCAQTPAVEEPVAGVVFEPATHELVRYLAEDWEALAPEKRPRIRLYAGYSGWAPKQLERELREQAWFTHKAKPEIVFLPNPKTAWKTALSDKGAYYKFVADTGYIPSLN